MKIVRNALIVSAAAVILYVALILCLFFLNASFRNIRVDSGNIQVINIISIIFVYLYLFSPFIAGSVFVYLLSCKESLKTKLATILVTEILIFVLFTLFGPDGVFTDRDTCAIYRLKTDGVNVEVVSNAPTFACFIKNLQSNIVFIGGNVYLILLTLTPVVIGESIAYLKKRLHNVDS